MTSELLNVLLKFDKTCKLIAGDYPRASTEYKQSSFVLGAQDMAMSFVSDLPVEERRLFAIKIDNIRKLYFPTSK